MINKCETTQEYIARYKQQYRKINSINCVALNLKVEFTMPGFKHLIYKGSRRRATKIIKSRLKLISLAVPVLKNAEEVLEVRIKKENHNGKKCEVRYEALDAIVSKSEIRVRVVVRTIGNKGKPHFYSIMRY